ncbi:MAG: YceI family protein [Thermoplasmatales archaeon]
MESQKNNWLLDKKHSSLEFSVRHMMVSTVKGRFREYEGEVTLDLDTLENSSALFSIDVPSITTEDQDRDNHLKSSDFFDASNNPKIMFKSTKIYRDGDEVIVEGNLTIRGITKMIKVAGQLEGPVKDPYGKERIGYDGEATVNRKDFDLKWNVMLEGGGLLVGDTVKINVHLELIKP